MLEKLDSDGWPLDLPIDAVKGFLAGHEGAALHRAALQAQGACLEIGSYCGKSTIYLGTACRSTGGALYALDHHRGSAEHQPGEEYHDSALYDSAHGVMDSFREFRRNIRAAGLEDIVVPLVAPSALVARRWAAPLALVFIDGGHSDEEALADYRAWAPKIQPGGLLAMHDIYLDPADGGQGPRAAYCAALDSGAFLEEPMVGSLGMLRHV